MGMGMCSRYCIAMYQTHTPTNSFGKAYLCSRCAGLGSSKSCLSPVLAPQKLSDLGLLRRNQVFADLDLRVFGGACLVKLHLEQVQLIHSLGDVISQLTVPFQSIVTQLSLCGCCTLCCSEQDCVGSSFCL